MAEQQQQQASRGKTAANGNGHDNSMADLQRQARRLGSELSEMGGTMNALVNDCRSVVREQLDQQPYVVLAIAAGVGYVLGGGLPRGILGRLLLFGGRMAIEGAVANYAAAATGTAPSR
jgi:hypothetical protein